MKTHRDGRLIMSRKSIIVSLAGLGVPATGEARRRGVGWG